MWSQESQETHKEVSMSKAEKERLDQLESGVIAMVKHMTDMGIAYQEITKILVELAGQEQLEADSLAASQAPSRNPATAELNKIMNDRMTQNSQMMRTFMEESLRSIRQNASRER